MHYGLILKQYFGYDSFRGIQKDIVESIGRGNDTLGLMPTGGGKSITFQVPALAMEGVCVVITPLISLMKDQVEHLAQRNIRAAFVNSTMTYSEILTILDNAVYGGLKFLYVSPERLSSSLFQTKIRQMKVCFIAVDEAHCISQWGYDFRPSYLEIAKIRELVPDAAILALTATATPEVIDDIMEQLHFRKPCVFRMSFKRENLVYSVHYVEDKFSELLRILNSIAGTAIVYVRNRKKTREIALALEQNGITASYYHAGLDFAVKNKKQTDWQNNEVRVMVATNAFGMGIDKPDVRVVVHMDCPDSIEAYFQEAGRAGRDGKHADAILLYTPRDRTSLLEHAQVTFPPLDYVRQVYDHLAYYFQLAVNCGEGMSFDLDEGKFCVTFRHHPRRMEAALAILQRAGYIDYDLDPDSKPRIMILVTREHINWLNDLSDDEYGTLLGLMRVYGSLFTSFSYIDLAKIAYKTGIAEEHVHVALKSLNRRGVVKYIPRCNTPYVTYTRQRIDSDRLHFPREVYDDLQERMQSRIDAMLHYAECRTECRSEMLLRYFGEKSEPCGKCDVCYEKDRQLRHVTEGDLSKTVIEYLKTHADATLYDLKSLCVNEKALSNALTALHDDGIIKLDGCKVHLT